MRRTLAAAAAAAAIAVVVDQTTKGLASQNHHISALETIGNDSTLAGTIPLGGMPLLAVAVVTAMVCTYIGWRLVRTGRIHPVVLGLLLGGGIGNLLDRALLGYVRDFMWIPGLVINVADIAIVVGVIGFLLGVYRTAVTRRSPTDRSATTAP